MLYVPSKQVVEEILEAPSGQAVPEGQLPLQAAEVRVAPRAPNRPEGHGLQSAAAPPAEKRPLGQIEPPSPEPGGQYLWGTQKGGKGRCCDSEPTTLTRGKGTVKPSTTTTTHTPSVLRAVHLETHHPAFTAHEVQEPPAVEYFPASHCRHADRAVFPDDTV